MSSINGAEVKKICLACEAGAGSSLMVKNGLVKKAKKDITLSSSFCLTVSKRWARKATLPPFEPAGRGGGPGQPPRTSGRGGQSGRPAGRPAGWLADRPCFT